VYLDFISPYALKVNGKLSTKRWLTQLGTNLHLGYVSSNTKIMTSEASSKSFLVSLDVDVTCSGGGTVLVHEVNSLVILVEASVVEIRAGKRVSLWINLGTYVFRDGV